ncbi:MAG: carbohydrate-binding protein, partial [Bacteroidota bacterium]|nr:carbohydrate-binding protein [Bacteroidota bacterium]
SITWDKVSEATGYIVRYGTEKNKLYNQFMVYQENQINIKCLNKGVGYFFSIDSFNENGVTKGNKIVEQSEQTQ